MSADELLTRLSGLNLQRPMEAAPLQAVGRQLSPAARLRRAADLPRGREVANAWGTHWLIHRRLDSLWPGGSRWIQNQREKSAGSDSAAIHARAAELRELAERFPGEAVFLDLETCGFAGSMVFLVGLIWRRREQLLVSQLLARDYAEEKPMLQTFWRIAAEKRLLVTFNGKSFDWPMLHDRSTLHHLGRDPRVTGPEQEANGPVDITLALSRSHPRPALTHCDLLHHARRRWKGQLPNCKLQTLEQLVCGRRRVGDMPGRQIPQAYHDFVRTQDASQLRSILHHNALDLITLLQLAVRLAL